MTTLTTTGSDASFTSSRDKSGCIDVFMDSSNSLDRPKGKLIRRFQPPLPMICQRRRAVPNSPFQNKRGRYGNKDRIQSEANQVTRLVGKRIKMIRLEKFVSSRCRPSN